MGPIKLNIGFTGTRKGMTPEQRKQVLYWLTIMTKIYVPTAHHGDCLGADAEFHELCDELKIPTRGHPPINPKYRAYCDFSLGCEAEKEYLERDRDIVNASTILFAALPGPYELNRRSGTWYTLNYAKERGVMYLSFNPDGGLIV